MSQISEITIFTEGDSTNADVWSNVPYYLANTLEAKGIHINRINLRTKKLLRTIYDKGICRFLRHTFMPHTSFAYERSLACHHEYNRVMRKAIKDYPDTDYFISTSFSFSPVSFTDKPCALFCDWTYQYYLEHFLQRNPDFLEKPEVIRQNRLLESVDNIFVLFPDVAKHMQKTYQNKKISYIGNVINSESVPDEPVIFPSKKLKKQSILFIGLPKYMEGVKSLIAAISLLRREPAYSHVTLDIIGMENTLFSDLPAYINCHGYLSKSNYKDKALYDSLLDHATLYVNTTPRWAGFSSTLEALYHYVPVITTPYESFCDTFGKTIDFGYYCDSNNATDIAALIGNVLALSVSDYTALCKNAHHAALPFTWDAYVDQMLDKMSDR